MLTIKKAIENRVNESVGWSESAPVPSGGVGETTADSAADSADNSADNSTGKSADNSADNSTGKSAGDHAGTGESHSHAIPRTRLPGPQGSITPLFARHRPVIRFLREIAPFSPIFLLFGAFMMLFSAISRKKPSFRDIPSA